MGSHLSYENGTPHAELLLQIKYTQYTQRHRTFTLAASHFV